MFFSQSGLMSYFVIMLVLLVFFLVTYWKIFTKAGQPGWACLVPVYNLIIFLRIVKKPWWWVFLVLLPVIIVFIFPSMGGMIAIAQIISIVVSIMLMHRLSRSFGHSTGFTVGLVLLGIVFLPILAFGSSRYTALKD